MSQKQTRAYEDDPRDKHLYKTWKWAKLSKMVRDQEPLCRMCKEKGIIRPSQVADHITPYPICGETGFYDRNNLQALCQECNHLKGQRDKKRIQQWKQRG